jgi:Na+/melibiose symporter-like transporter
MSMNSLFGTVASIIVLVATPLLYPAIGWRLTAALFAVPAALLMTPFARKGKERYINKDEEKVTFRALFRYVKSNKFLLIYFSGLTLMNLTSTAGTIATYFAEYCLNSPAMTSAVVACLALPILAVAVLMPKITKKIDKFHVLMFSAISNSALGVIGYLAGYRNLALFFSIVVVRGVLSGAVLLTQIMFTGDFVEYGEYKTGKRMQGIAYALQTFTFKFFNAIPAASAMLILGLAGFKEGAGAAQSQGAIDVIWFLFSLFPSISVVISIPVMLRYKLRDKDVQLMASVNSGELAREEAEKLLSRKY